MEIIISILSVMIIIYVVNIEVINNWLDHTLLKYLLLFDNIKFYVLY